MKDYSRQHGKYAIIDHNTMYAIVEAQERSVDDESEVVIAQTGYTLYFTSYQRIATATQRLVRTRKHAYGERVTTVERGKRETEEDQGTNSKVEERGK